MAMVVLAAMPIPTQVFTVKVDPHWPWKNTPIVVSALAPSDTTLFEDEKEVLASIISFIHDYFLLSIGMTTVSSTNL